MSARSNMTMRATVTRDVLVTSDTWGGEDAPAFVEVGVVPCRAWSKRTRGSDGRVDNQGEPGIIEDMRAMVPAGADVEENDRLVIHDRMGRVVFGGPVAVEIKARVGGPHSVTSYDELMLTRHV